MSSQNSSQERLNYIDDSTKYTDLALNGGSKIRTDVWPSYDRGFLDLGRSEEAAASRVLKSQRLFRYDDRAFEDTECGKLERELASFFEAKYVLACSSGTTAIALALMGAGIGPGDIVACPAFTFAATPSAIKLIGAIPLIIEVDENLHLDPIDLVRKMAPDVKAIIAVHMRGFACNIEEISKIAERFGAPLIEDAVPALGVSVHGKQLGTFGNAGAFSTQSDKAINTGEGGFIVTSDADLFARAVVLSGAYESRLFRHIPQSETVQCDLSLPIFSFRMDEVRAAIARVQLEGLANRVSRHQDNYGYVVGELKNEVLIKIREPIASQALLGESLIFRIPNAEGSEVRWFSDALKAEGISARYLGDDGDVNVRCFWNWKFVFGSETKTEVMARFPNSTRYLREAIDIPLSCTIKQSDCDDLVRAIRKVAMAYRSFRRS